MYKKEIEKQGKSRGITLIALIVTVTVLAILIGVSVNTVVGQNGLVNHAESTRDDTEDTIAFEQIQIEVLRSKIADRKKDYSILKSNLEKLGITGLYNEEIYPIYINYEGYDFKIDRDWNVSKGREIVYEASNLTFNGTSDYTDTGIKLFDEENFDKDFQIRVVISEFGDNAINETIVSEMKEDSSLNYSGISLRFTDDFGENARIIELEGNENGNNDKKFIKKDELLNKVFVIARIDGIIYYYNEYKKEPVWFKDVSQIPKFDTPVTIGCSLDANGNPLRYFKGKISNVQIIIYDDELKNIKAPDKEIYVKLYNDTLVFSKENITLTNRTLTKDYGNIANGQYTSIATSTSDTPWWEDRNYITKVEILDPICPKYMKCWFAYLSNLEEIMYIENIDTRYVTNMDYIFCNNKFRTIDLSNFDTSSVTDMKYMFSGCQNLETIDISNFNFYILNDCTGIFNGCSNLTTELTINDNVTTYTDMFKNAATASGAQITVNYTSETETLVNNMIATKSSGSNVEKGSKID